MSIGFISYHLLKADSKPLTPYYVCYFVFHLWIDSWRPDRRGRLL